MIDLIENPEEKLKWLTRIKSEILEEKEENRNQEKFKGYDFNKILQRAKQEERKITVNDLHREINILKEEIRKIRLELTKLQPSTSYSRQEEEDFVSQIKIYQQKWRVKIALRKKYEK